MDIGTYAVVITSRKEVGSFLGFPVYRLMSMRVLACNDALRYSTAQEVRIYKVRNHSGSTKILYM